MLEPWNCGHCGQLIYAVATSAEGHLVPYFESAPEPAAVIESYGKVCRTCAEMYAIAYANPWFRGLHDEWQKSQDHANRRLRPGRNYLE